MQPLLHAERAELAVLLQDPELRERELREAIRSARQIGAPGWVKRFESLL